MKESEAKKIFWQLIRERNAKAAEIIKQAEADGTWRGGLDANKHLFKELDAECDRKIRDLAAQIDDGETE